MSGQPVDVLAVMELTPNQLRMLRAMSQDTGAFRVNNKQATELAEACAAALKMAEARAAVAALYAQRDGLSSDVRYLLTLIDEHPGRHKYSLMVQSMLREIDGRAALATAAQEGNKA